MNHKQRQLAAIRHELTDRISVQATAVENDQAIAEHLGIDVSQVWDTLGIDGRVVGAAYTGAVSGQNDTDEWDIPSGDDYGTCHRYPLSGDESISELQRHPWPDPAKYDYAAAAETARQLDKTYAVRGPNWRPLFCRVCGLLGMENAMMKMLTEPAYFEAVLDAVFRWTYEYSRRLLEACGQAMPILCLGDDFATQRGMMISPNHWRRFLKPQLARLFELGKRTGRFVWFHSCGDITPILPDLIDIGADVWETVQLHTLPITPEQLNREFGRHVTFFGGICTQRLPFATPRQIRDEVRRTIEALGEGGGYICGPDHHVKPDVPPQNALALFEEATAFRREGYTLAG